MNDIGIGIMCFGDKKYFYHTQQLIILLEDVGITTYILTDQPYQFPKSKFIKTINYNRNIKSYHDKLLISKEVLKIHNICILIDSDVIIQDDTFIDDINEYKFEKGITYIDTLKSHECKMEFIRDIGMNPENIDWYNYRKYLEKVYPQYGDLETIYEYFIVINKE